jgi:hypothetical protein
VISSDLNRSWYAVVYQNLQLKRKTTKLVATLCLLGVSTLSGAKIVTRCEGGRGYGYYIEGGAVPSDRAGWTEDCISHGSYLLLRDRDGFDIIYSDSTGATISSRDDGAIIELVSEEGPNIVISLNYANRHFEVWAFELDASGRGEVTFHQARFGTEAPVRKHSLMRASCSR